MNAIAILLLLSVMAMPLVAQPTEWRPAGMGGGGALFLPSISPFDSRDIYVACDMSQLFHTVDRGESWRQVDHRELQVNGSLGRVQFTDDPFILYTIDYTGELPRPSLSTDAGATWTPLTVPSSATPYALFTDASSHSRLVMAAGDKLYVSADGLTFEPRFDIGDDVVAGVVFDDTTIYVGVGRTVLRSTDRGATFLPLPVTALPSNEAMVSFTGARVGNTTRLCCVTLDAGSVYPETSGADHGDYRGVYTLDVGASSWTSRASAVASGLEPVFAAMSRSDVGRIYLAGYNGNDNAPLVLRSNDGGASWTSVFRTDGNANIATGWSGDGGDRGWSYGEFAEGFAVSPVDPSHLVLTDLGFVHLSTDGGESWRQAYLSIADQNPSGSSTPSGKAYRSSGLENTTCWSICWASAQKLVVGFSDIRGIVSSDGGASWSQDYSGHTLNSMYRVVRASGGMLYAATSSVHDMYQSTYLTDARIDNGRGQVLSSSDMGRTWNVLHDFGHPVVWVATDPTGANRLYASVVHSSDGGIYVSNDIDNGAASTWTRLAVPPRTEGHPFNIVVLSDGSLLCSYSGRRDGSGFTASSGVFYSTDGGASWTDRSSPSMRYWTKDVVVDPSDPTESRWYAGVFSGWGGAPNGLGGLYRTTDKGITWTRILERDRVTSCTIHPVRSNEMYVTTETEGLWFSDNANAAAPVFTQVAGYPFRQPERVFFNPHDLDDVWVTSFGNGLRRGRTSGSPVRGGERVERPGIEMIVYPNPSRDRVGVEVDLQAAADVELSILDVRGEVVASIDRGMMSRGRHTIDVDVTGLLSGVYSLRLRAGTEIATGKLEVVR